ncbi:MAG TPA: DUF2202 domain-containing protein [Chitinophagaceae bacterium]|nr:DUF2202 domain-containing protein [Chitinophagaceae bacterium]
MKKYFISTAMTVTLFLSVIFVSCSKDKDNKNANNNLNSQVNNLPSEPLNTDERTTLSFMREEEKLARDVYIFLYNKWALTIFNNISSSEQSHMNAVVQLLSKYNLPDPVGSNGYGIFSNPVLQNLYTQLTTQGSVSLPDALKVGATIEDLDIYDLTIALTKVDNQDITLVYNNLVKGSRNHLRSFYSNIINAGGTYTPQYITQAEFDAIINSPMEIGN